MWTTYKRQIQIVAVSLFAIITASMCSRSRGDQQLAATPAGDGGMNISVVDTQQVMHVGPEKDGKRAVRLVLDGKVYEGSVTEVKAPAAAAASKKAPEKK